MGAITRAAEGYDRRAFTVEEVLRMQGVGIFSERERYELIAGEIVSMQSKGPLHETLKSELTIAMAKALPDNLILSVEPSVYLSKDTFVDPDLIVFPRRVTFHELKGADILLLIEVAASSLTYDKGVKVDVYAKYKVHEYWVVDAYTRTTHQFFDPHRGKWRRRAEVGPGKPLTHALLPGFSIRLSDY
jgi:Uma2 family endonuclease